MLCEGQYLTPRPTLLRSSTLQVVSDNGNSLFANFLRHNLSFLRHPRIICLPGPLRRAILAARIRRRREGETGGGSVATECGNGQGSQGTGNSIYLFITCSYLFLLISKRITEG